jgi:hypothetical protein
LLKRRKTGFIEVRNDNLAFVSLGEDSTWDCLENIPLSGIFEDNSTASFPSRLKDYSFSILIVPDFWFGNLKYPFHSRNKSVVRAFLSRKLASEFPQLQKIKDFFSYNMIKNEKGEQEVVVSFPQEQRFFDLYQVLSQNNLKPIRITSPAMVWNRRLRHRVDNFDKTGVGFICLLDNKCSLFFYYQGHFLFSRVISLPSLADEQAEQLGVIAFEMNQSIYHFSQRTKADIEKIYFASINSIEIDQFSETLGREVLMLPQRTGHNKGALLHQKVGEAAVADFLPDEILEPLSLPGISDRAALNELELKKIQFSGFITGILLLIVLIFVSMFLNQLKNNELLSLSTTEASPTQSIGQYNEALDVLLNESVKKDPMILLGHMASCVPSNIRVESLDISTDPSVTISFAGIITANGADDFSSSLKAFLGGINANLKGISQLTMEGVEIEEIEGRPEDVGRNYHISFKMDVS